VHTPKLTIMYPRIVHGPLVGNMGIVSTNTRKTILRGVVSVLKLKGTFLLEDNGD